MSHPLTESEAGVRAVLRVTPHASRNLIEGIRDGKLLVKVTAAPDDNEANVAVIKLLSKTWRIPATSIEILSGHSAREKVLMLHGAKLADLPAIE
jgi:uncharacterized protein